MKNEKINEVLDVVIKVISIVSILAQAIKSAFPVASKSLAGDDEVTLSEQKTIMEFLKGDK